MKVVLYQEKLYEKRILEASFYSTNDELITVESIGDLHDKLRIIAPDLVIIDNKKFCNIFFSIKNHIIEENSKFIYINMQEQIDDAFFLQSKNDNSNHLALILQKLYITKILSCKDPITKEQLAFFHDIGITPPLAIIMRFMVLHTGEEVSLSDIEEELWHEKNGQHQQTIYGYIHRIRQIFKQIDMNINIIRTRKGLYTIKSI